LQSLDVPDFFSIHFLSTQRVDVMELAGTQREQLSEDMRNKEKALKLLDLRQVRREPLWALLTSE
jgi:hypothetical protein